MFVVQRITNTETSKLSLAHYHIAYTKDNAIRYANLFSKLDGNSETYIVTNTDTDEVVYRINK